MYKAIKMIANSSLQFWLDYGLDYSGALHTAIPPCHWRPAAVPGGVPFESPQNYKWGNASLADNCTHVCNSSSDLLDPDMPENLAICGLWSSLTLLPPPNSNDSSLALFTDRVDNITAVLDAFSHMGLNHSDAKYTFSVRDNVASSLSILYTQVMSGTYLGEGSIPISCSEQELFPREYGNWAPTKALQDCLDAICSPGTLNPDFGGIGVSLCALLSCIQPLTI